jgi:hypothetical protein
MTNENERGPRMDPHTGIYEEPPISALEDELGVAMEDAQAAQARYECARAAFSASLAKIMGILLPIGTIIDRHERRPPRWLFNVKTMAGNDRGANRFQIVGPITIDPVLTHPTLSNWYCDAVPLSPKTGKPMSARTHGADSAIRGGVCRIKAHVYYITDDEDGNDAILKLAAEAAAR